MLVNFNVKYCFFFTTERSVIWLNLPWERFFSLPHLHYRCSFSYICVCMCTRGLKKHLWRIILHYFFSHLSEIHSKRGKIMSACVKSVIRKDENWQTKAKPKWDATIIQSFVLLSTQHLGNLSLHLRKIYISSTWTYLCNVLIKMETISIGRT